VKALKTEELFKVCAATPEQIEGAVKLLGKAVRSDAEWLKTGLKKGNYQAATVQVKSLDRFLLVFHVNEQKVLFINAAVQLAKDYCDFEILIDSILAVAREKGCQAIEAMTMRAGLLKKVMQHGFVPIGVSFQKTL
jgi:hypothetical protein